MTITSPFHTHSTAAEVIAEHDLTGKTAIVTGASSGLGIETARALLSGHAEVILAVRDTAKGERVAQALRASTSNTQAHVLALDLGSLAGVRQVAEQFRARWSKLDLLINNAGIMATPQGYTPDGVEQQFGTNHLGHYLLTLLLLPPLQAAAPSCSHPAVIASLMSTSTKSSISTAHITNGKPMGNPKQLMPCLRSA
jgi:NAD(P)-dependent dehydrogenase (short-subunit alcohol dehydrogenase family)